MEIWKDIIGYEGYYQVSSFGNVKSLDRLVKHWTGSYKIQKGILLNPIKTKQGYIRTSFRLKGTRKFYFIHRLVCLMFIPNPENKPQVNHINGIKTDNRVENLEWCTDKENKIHSIENNLKKMPKGEANTGSKLKNEDIIRIRELNQYISQTEISKTYNVSQSLIHRIVKKKIWKHI